MTRQGIHFDKRGYAMKDPMIEREGKLIIEFNGRQYQMMHDEESGTNSFIGGVEDDLEKLRLAYAKEVSEEWIEADKRGAYWYERPYCIGTKAAEALGAKIIEYEDEKYRTFYDDGTPILY